MLFAHLGQSFPTNWLPHFIQYFEAGGGCADGLAFAEAEADELEVDDVYVDEPTGQDTRRLLLASMAESILAESCGGRAFCEYAQFSSWYRKLGNATI